MIFHQHPYPPFLPTGATKIIVGTIPPPRFSLGELFDEDVDFGYGSKYGLLWPILENLFEASLDYQNTTKAIDQRKRLLHKHGIGICDMVASCQRERQEASDLGMKRIELRDLVKVLRQRPSLKRILFMGGVTKNGPEFLFRKLLKKKKMALIQKQGRSPRIHTFLLEGREIEAISLISPSSAANRSIGANPLFKERRRQDPKYSTLDFRIEQYGEFFQD